ncbi:MAG: 23S rRNA (adenine(2503)-C(2))-methyltransferase RlmN [Peptostreptococcales bacterium]
MSLININNLTKEELRSEMEKLNEKPFRANQIFSWLQKGVTDFDAMKNLSETLKSKLQNIFYIDTLRIEKVLESKEDGTKKYLFRLRDDYVIESVFMKYDHGNTVCISSQVGCNMGCKFCASTIGGCQRNLLASEMAEQMIRIQNHVGERISNIVIMGSGEPLENFDQLMRFFNIIHDKDGLNIGLRNITISTCGLVPAMLEFGRRMPQVNLAISLHAPHNAIRNKMMAINKKYPVEAIIAAAKEYTAMTHRRITFEYVLIDGLNDSIEQARELSSLLKNMLCHVNLIPLNDVEEFKYKGASHKKVMMFKKELERNNINVTIRREMGSDINGACGQLRRRSRENRLN